MTPLQQHTANMYSDSDYPTSPWTEAYHAMSAEQPTQTPAAKQGEDCEAIQPTRDALSDIYNRGY